MPEWYTLDSSLRRADVIEGFESFIWTERYWAWGDFQVITKSTYNFRQLLAVGTRISKKDSKYVMTVETILDAIDEEGKKLLTITGRSFESILDDRVAMPALASLTATPKWNITGTPGAIARYIFDQICVQHILGAGDTIPFFHSGTFLPAGTIPEPSSSVTLNLDPDSVYNDLALICQVWSLGFRLARNADTGYIYFDVYTGKDRTSAQSANALVVFSQDMESIDKTSVIKSAAALKTVAYVFAQNGAMVVYADGHGSYETGSDRRILLVKADDIETAAGSQLNSEMTQRGMEALADYREIYAFDGEIPQHLPYIYGIDYGLGDLVEERGPDGISNIMLVTEQIFVSDSEGDRSYPTLTQVSVIMPGSWLTLPIGEHWNDIAAGIHWDDL